MFSEKDLVARSIEDMTQEFEELMAESKRLRQEYEAAVQKEGELRRESVDCRPTNPACGEALAGGRASQG
jgi:hypothetical protein